MDQAKPWYQSLSILSLIAGVLLALGTKFDLFPEGVTQDSIVQFLLVVVPMLIALWGRITAKKVVTVTKAGAERINSTL
jgi:hypothetical protein